MSQNKKYGKRNQRQNTKGKRPNTKPESQNQTGYDATKSNNITWWNRSPMFADVTRVPFNRLYGAPVDIQDIQPITDVVPTGVLGDNVAFPTVMRLNYYPVVGYSTNVNSPVNRCFTSIQAAIYAKTTGAMQFTQANLAFNVMAVDSILTNIAMVKRALGLSLVYSGANLAYPRMLIAAGGIDPDSVIGKQDEIRRKLNDLIQNLNALAIPGILDIYERHYALAHNAYIDEDDIRSHVYIFTPLGYWEHKDAGMGERHETECLEFKSFPFEGSDSTVRAQDVLGAITSQLNAIRHSTAWYLVSGSIQRTFPESSLLRVEYVPVDYVQTPTFDRNIRYQVNNAVMVGTLYEKDLDIYEDVVGDALIFKPLVPKPEFKTDPVPYAALMSNHVLNSFDGNTDSEFIMEATRLMVMGHLETDSQGTTNIVFSNSGTELVAYASVYYMNDEDSSHPWTTLPFKTFIKGSAFGSMIRMGADLAYFSKFRNCPLVYITNDNQIAPPIGDLYRWTLIDQSSLEGLHECALMSIFTTIATLS